MRMAVNYECAPCVATSVIHFQLHESGGLGASDVANMVSDLAGYWINDVWKTFALNTATTTTVDATYALIEGQPNVKRVRISDAILGMQAPPAAFGQCAYLLNWDTGDARKGGKPRTYLPFIPESAEADPANITPAKVTAINAALVTFLGHVQGHTVGQLVCDHFIEYSTVNKGAYRSSGAAFNILEGSCNPVVATQRRRVDRVRP